MIFNVTEHLKERKNLIVKKLKSFITFLRSFAKYAGLIAWIVSIQYITSNIKSILMAVFLSIVAAIVILAILIGLDVAEYVVEQKIADTESKQKGRNENA